MKNEKENKRPQTDQEKLADAFWDMMPSLQTFGEARKRQGEQTWKEYFAEMD